MKSKLIYIILGIVIILLAVCVYVLQQKKSQLTAPHSGAMLLTQTKVYENEYMKLSIPEGWTATQSNKNSGAVNITKGNYILYINTQASQASGVTGGRFSEIAMGAPSADAVIKSYPGPECGKQEKYNAFESYQRIDLYVSTTDAVYNCNVPKSGTVWYFSYLTTSKGGYFNYYKDDEAPGLVVTMAYNAKDLNRLPQKGSAELTAALAEMTDIVKTLEVKHTETGTYTNDQFGVVVPYEPNASFAIYQDGKFVEESRRGDVAHRFSLYFYKHTAFQGILNNGAFEERLFYNKENNKWQVILGVNQLEVDSICPIKLTTTQHLPYYQINDFRTGRNWQFAYVVKEGIVVLEVPDSGLPFKENNVEDLVVDPTEVKFKDPNSVLTVDCVIKK